MIEVKFEINKILCLTQLIEIVRNTATPELVVNRKTLIKSQKQELLRNGILENNIIIKGDSATNEIKNKPEFHNLIQNILKF